MKGSKETETPQISTFIRKLCKLLDDARYKNIINWTPDGTSITIDCHNEVLDTILDKYFNHTKIASFVRQLNLYGFKKISKIGSKMMYKHEYFIKDQIDLRKMVKRKKRIKTKPQNIEIEAEKVQNPVLQNKKTKISILQEINSRVKEENQKIRNQSLRFKSQIQTLQQIKESSFFTSLKNVYAHEGVNSQKNRISKNLANSFPNGQLSNLDATSVQTKEFQKSQQNYDYLDSDKQKGQNDENSDESDDDNEMGMFSEKIEELKCEKMSMMSMNPGREASFWKEDQDEMEERKQK